MSLDIARCPRGEEWGKITSSGESLVCIRKGSVIFVSLLVYQNLQWLPVSLKVHHGPQPPLWSIKKFRLYSKGYEEALRNFTERMKGTICIFERLHNLLKILCNIIYVGLRVNWKGELKAGTSVTRWEHIWTSFPRDAWDWFSLDVDTDTQFLSELCISLGKNGSKRSLEETT